ncbi:MAG: hypothetical protein GY742_03890 [Hyphomicrobiales bacterium]|nr:hypothetical protein [Hyphomicrobiales bacterium]
MSQIIVSVILAATFWQPANAQSDAESIIESWVEATDGFAFVEISYDNISHDSASNLTSIRNLAIKFTSDNQPGKNEKDVGDDNSVTKPIEKTEADIDGKKSLPKFHYTFTFPTVSFDNLTYDGDYYSVHSINADITKVEFGISNTQESDSTATGTYDNLEIKNVRWASLPEIVEDKNKLVSSYFPLVEALLDISFDNASIDSMTMVQKLGKPEITTRSEFGRMEIGKTIRGNFSSMHMAGMKMEMGDEFQSTSANFPYSRFNIGEMTMSDYNYRTFLNKFKPDLVASNSDNPFETLSSNMSMNDISVFSKAGKFSLDRITVNDVGVRSLDFDILSEMDRFALAAKNGENIPEDEQFVKMIASIYGMFRLGEFSMTGMKFTSSDAGEGKMGIIRIADLSANGLGKFSLEGTSFQDNKGRYFDLGLFSLSDLKFPSFQSLTNLEKAVKANNIGEMMKAIPTLASMVVKGLVFHEADKGEISVDENSLKMADFIGPIPTRLDILVKNMRFPVDMMDKKARQGLKAMGYEDVEFSYDIEAEWEEATSVLSVQSDTQLNDGGSLNIDMAIGGIPRSIFENPMTAQSAVAFATINRAKVTFVDDSIVNRGLALAGATQGVNAETMKAQVIGMLPIMLQQLEKPAFVDHLTATVKKFLDVKGTISASIAPASPVLILQLIGAATTAPGAAIDLLNVNIESY